jgi:hypothetical protein
MSRSRLVSAWVLNDLDDCHFLRNEMFRTIESLVEDRGGKDGTDGLRNFERKSKSAEST